MAVIRKHGEPFTEDEADLLVQVSSQLSIAIEVLLLETRMRGTPAVDIGEGLGQVRVRREPVSDRREGNASRQERLRKIPPRVAWKSQPR